MMRFLRIWLIGAVLLSLAGACDTQNAPDPSGDYQLLGETVKKQRLYTGVLRIAPHGPGYHLTWLLDRREIYRGTALYTDNVLGAVYWSGPAPTPDLAVAIYRINGGELDGTWIPAANGAAARGREVLKGSPGIAGRYQIALGQNPDGSAYSGSVQIDRRGKIYELRWYLPGPSYVGRGVRLGDLLVVGYASGGAPGIVAYCMTTENGNGVWSYGGAKGVGTEVISRGIKKDAFGEADIVSIESKCKAMTEQSIAAGST